MKHKLVLMMLLLAIVVCSAGAQEDIAGMINTAKGTASGWIAKLAAMLAPIGAMFGNTFGVRIGGTTGTGIAALVLAKVVENKTPSWVKWLLYLTGGTMFAGGGANVTQLVMGYMGQ